jgi:hypothetical protein
VTQIKSLLTKRLMPLLLLHQAATMEVCCRHCGYSCAPEDALAH